MLLDFNEMTAIGTQNGNPYIIGTPPRPFLLNYSCSFSTIHNASAFRPGVEIRCHKDRKIRRVKLGEKGWRYSKAGEEEGE